MTVERVYEVMAENPLVALGGDFHAVLGEDVFLFYSCPSCHMFPINPRRWLRTVRAKNRHEPGCTQQGGEWRCPTPCLEKWSWRSGASLRALIAPYTTEVGDEDLKIMILGGVTDEQEHTITLLKSARLVKEFKDEGSNPFLVGKAGIIAAIDKLNHMVEGRLLSSTLPARAVKTATHAEIVEKGVYPYCEDKGLSLRNPGVTINMMYMAPDTPVIDPDVRRQLLDMLVCFYDFSQNKPAKKGALYRAWENAMAAQDMNRPIFFERKPPRRWADDFSDSET